MINGKPDADEEFTIEANSITTLRIQKDSENILEWDIKNLLTGYEEYLHVVLNF